MKQYPKYKDSGIQWIGQIPEGWNVGRLKDISVFINGYAFNSNTFSKEYGKRVIRIGDIGSTIDYVNCIRTTEQNDALGLYRIYENDILIAMSGATTGKSCLAVNVEEAYINQRVGIIRSEHYGYISYILQMPYLSEYISLNDAGSAQPNISGKSIGNLPISIPPVSEQESIARYLDDKTAKIDETVNLLVQQKADLQQYRKALISQTVTRGLNPNAKLKDSDISWIGQIPEGWKVGRLKDISAFINGYAFNSNTFSKEYGKRVIRIGDIGSTIDYVNCIRTTEQNDALELYKIHENDILIAMSGATTGKSCLAVNVEEAYINQRVGIIRSEHYGYISYILQMPYLNEYISLNDAGSAQPNVSGKSIGNLPIPLPPLTEQQAIADFLDSKTATIDQSIANIETQIADLRAYRTALISDVVTGKIDVRN